MIFSPGKISEASLCLYALNIPYRGLRHAEYLDLFDHKSLLSEMTLHLLWSVEYILGKGALQD